MIARLFLYIKHHLPWLWWVVDLINGALYSLIHQKCMQKQVLRAFDTFELGDFTFRPLNATDLPGLKTLIETQGAERLRYFQPHGFNQHALKSAFRNPAFLMFGVFFDRKQVGYFFLRCFWNRKCFVGRLIDKNFERKGIGRVMNQVLYHVAWWSGFRCMTTISKDNAAIMRSHANNPCVKVLGDLPNNFILVEFVQNSDKP